MKQLVHVAWLDGTCHTRSFASGLVPDRLAFRVEGSVDSHFLSTDQPDQVRQVVEFQGAIHGVFKLVERDWRVNDARRL